MSIAPEVTQQLIEQEITNWRNTQELLRIRYKVNEAIGDEHGMEVCKSETERCIKAIETLEKMQG